MLLRIIFVSTCMVGNIYQTLQPYNKQINKHLVLTLLLSAIIFSFDKYYRLKHQK